MAKSAEACLRRRCAALAAEALAIGAIWGLGLVAAAAQVPGSPVQGNSAGQPAVSKSTPSPGRTKAAGAAAVAAAASGTVRLEAVTFADLPGWEKDDHLAALKAFLKSCPRLAQALAAGNKAGRMPTPPELMHACAAARALPAKITRAAAKAYFERHFVPSRIVHAGNEGLFTGYYEPLLEGSRKREGRFQTPIHRRPADLVNVVDEASRAIVGSKHTHARQTKAGLVAFPTRAQIDGGALDGLGLELLYLADPVDVFFLQVQGSGRVKLPDGAIVRINYDGKNGHPYTSIGRYLIDKGIIGADTMSLAALATWLRADLARGRQVMHQNASYVFFRELARDSEGPLGVLDVPLTPGRSLAVDPSVHVLGQPVYVSAPTLTHAVKGMPFQRLMVAQDVGSAIKGPERGDIYFGSGDAAGRIAGVTKHPGHMFVLTASRAHAEPTGGDAKSSGKRQSR